MTCAKQRMHVINIVECISNKEDILFLIYQQAIVIMTCILQMSLKQEHCHGISITLVMDKHDRDLLQPQHYYCIPSWL